MIYFLPFPLLIIIEPIPFYTAFTPKSKFNHRRLVWGQHSSEVRMYKPAFLLGRSPPVALIPPLPRGLIPRQHPTHHFSKPELSFSFNFSLDFWLIFTFTEKYLNLNIILFILCKVQDCLIVYQGVR